MKDELEMMNYLVPKGPFVQFIIKNSSLIICFLLLMLSACGLGLDTAGTSSGGETTNAVSGIVHADSGGPAMGVSVTLYSKEYNPNEDGAVKESFTDVTDEQGQYVFKKVSAGEYNIQAVSSVSNVNALAQDVVAPDEKVESVLVQDMSLQIPGTVTLSLTETTLAEGGVVYIPGTNISKTINSIDLGRGAVSLEGVPVGSFSEIAYKNETKVSAVNLTPQQVEVVSADTVVVIAYPDWHFSKKILVNTTQTGGYINENLVNFPLLIRLNSDNFDFSQARASGQDLRFSQSLGSVMDYEIERWDSAGAMAEIWVKMDTVYGNNNTQFFYMCWGNANAEGRSDGGVVFDTVNGFTGVWHLNEGRGSGSDTYKDATYNRDNGTSMPGAASVLDVESVAGKGQEFDGGASYIDLQTSDNLDGAMAMTISFWCKADVINFSTNRGIFSRGSAATVNAPFIFGQADSDVIALVFQTDSTSHKIQTASLKQGQWHYVSFSWNGSSVTAYLDGVAGSTVMVSAGSQLNATNGFNYLGSMDNSGVWDGKLDEIRSSVTNRSADWIKFSYENQKIGSAVVRFQ
ncbi:MAG: DUF2341 domain-containing protein [Fibrobacteria bacterium]|nr:DUF2341 domain-containing protein [Fibrobacteria bacterium]